MISTAFIRWAGRQLKPFTDHREARQRQERFARMLMVDRDLRAAHERRLRRQRLHDASGPDLKIMQDRLHNMLRRSVAR